MSLHQFEGETEAITALISNSLPSIKAYLNLQSYSYLLGFLMDTIP